MTFTENNDKHSGQSDKKQNEKVDTLTESSNSMPKEHCTVANDLERYVRGLKYTKKKTLGCRLFS